MRQLGLFPTHGITCDKCGEVSPNDYLHTLNHHQHGQLCKRQQSALRHIANWLTGPPLAHLVATARNYGCTPDQVNRAIEKRHQKDTHNDRPHATKRPHNTDTR